ncbi:hypothetical protein KDA_33440 [Dictyobacter alpinus]|uniref:Uncharacterized protein n=1 Tax=Dictyobacter alpinus TaxID=2014873 RepID=A0A402B969_9CHLR|nr:hypothetical protein [Dictyobacter alpinus]GCE27860.1 hypothetical protein KDA_33440 [Dictyobacter alpinus]
MDFDDELFEQEDKIGSDDLLAADDLRLPESANPLVRLHAMRSWLKRKEKEANLDMGTAALDLQDLQVSSETAHLRRRAYQEQQEQLQIKQNAFQQAQERMAAYEEADDMLEDCVNHTTVSERLMVEYYLQVEELIQTGLAESDQVATPRLEALYEVQNRIERIGASYEED